MMLINISECSLFVRQLTAQPRAQTFQSLKKFR